MAQTNGKNNLETEDMERELPPADANDGYTESSTQAQPPLPPSDELQ